MRSRKLPVGLPAVLAIFTLSLLVTSTGAVAQQETVLLNFNSTAGGRNPYQGLIFDSAGNLYGTTSLGGAHSQGVVFELTPKAAGKWAEKALYSFNNNNFTGRFGLLVAREPNYRLAALGKSAWLAKNPHYTHLTPPEGVLSSHGPSAHPLT